MHKFLRPDASSLTLFHYFFVIHQEISLAIISRLILSDFLYFCFLVRAHFEFLLHIFDDLIELAFACSGNFQMVAPALFGVSARNSFSQLLINSSSPFVEVLLKQAFIFMQKLQIFFFLRYCPSSHAYGFFYWLFLFFLAFY